MRNYICWLSPKKEDRSSDLDVYGDGIRLRFKTWGSLGPSLNLERQGYVFLNLDRSGPYHDRFNSSDERKGVVALSN